MANMTINIICNIFILFIKFIDYDFGHDEVNIILLYQLP